MVALILRLLHQTRNKYLLRISQFPDQVIHLCPKYEVLSLGSKILSWWLCHLLKFRYTLIFCRKITVYNQSSDHIIWQDQLSLLWHLNLNSRDGVNKERKEILILHINKCHYRAYKTICKSFTLPHVWKNCILNTE